MGRPAPQTGAFAAKFRATFARHRRDAHATQAQHRRDVSCDKILKKQEMLHMFRQKPACCGCAERPSSLVKQRPARMKSRSLKLASKKRINQEQVSREDV
jgi:hypothetical protein